VFILFLFQVFDLIYYTTISDKKTGPLSDPAFCFIVLILAPLNPAAQEFCLSKII